MTTRNSITGDAIKTKVAYGESAKNFERGWELLQQGENKETSEAALPPAESFDFLFWLAKEHYKALKNYKGMWEYQLSKFEQETQTSPEWYLLDDIIKGDIN